MAIQATPPITENSREETAVTDVMVIDDDPVALELIARFLKASDYSALYFDDPLQALDFLKSNAVRLLLIDNRMPVLSGLEVLAAMAATERAAIPSIYLCSAAELPRVMKEQARALGATPITKDLIGSRQGFLDFVSVALAKASQI